MIRQSLITLAILGAFASTVTPATASQGISPDDLIAAREGTEAPRGRDTAHPGGHKAFDDSFQIAREASEGPRGRDNERPGDRQRRGGKAFDDSFQIAREGTEAPRGRDTAHPGGHKAFDDSFKIARETSEGPRGADNERPGDRHGRGRGRGGRLMQEIASV